MQAYVEAYVDRFGLRPFIRLGSEVAAARPNDAGWTLDVRQTGSPANSGVETHVVDWLIVCNGIFSTPAIPAWPGAEAFVAAGGAIAHTSQFSDGDAARAKHVLVIGYGKSSCDVAGAVAQVSASTTVLARNLIWKIPKKLANVLNFKHLFLTRMGEGLFRYIEVRGFEKFLHGPGLTIRNAMLASVEGVIARQLKLQALGLHPGKPLETIARSTVGGDHPQKGR
jgi:cation diffusion facilitator CzcD-associated flavoprotein CzcO